MIRRSCREYSDCCAPQRRTVIADVEHASCSVQPYRGRLKSADRGIQTRYIQSPGSGTLPPILSRNPLEDSTRFTDKGRTTVGPIECDPHSILDLLDLLQSIGFRTALRKRDTEYASGCITAGRSDLSGLASSQCTSWIPGGSVAEGHFSAWRTSFMGDEHSELICYGRCERSRKNARRHTLNAPFQNQRFRCTVKTILAGPSNSQHAPPWADTDKEGIGVRTVSGQHSGIFDKVRLQLNEARNERGLRISL